MTGEQLKAARKYHDALVDVLSKCVGGRAAYHTVLEIRHLCRAAFVAVEDDFCREQLGLIEAYAADLFSKARHKPWHRGPVSGIDVLTHKIEKCLGAFEARLIKHRQ